MLPTQQAFSKGSVRDMLLCMALALPVFIWRASSGVPAELSARNLLIFLLAAPVAEELIFRGIFLELLIRRSDAFAGRLLANLCVSVVFAGGHYLPSGDVWRLLVFFPSFLLGLHYMKHRRVAPVILIHAFYNLSVFI